MKIIKRNAFGIAIILFAISSLIIVFYGKAKNGTLGSFNAGLFIFAEIFLIVFGFTKFGKKNKY